MKRILVIAAACVAVCAATAGAQSASKSGKDAKALAPDNYDAVFQHYLEAARRQSVTVSPDPASWMNSLMSDPRARHVNDLLTVRVVENVTATNTADSTLSKAGTTGLGIPNLLGLESKAPSGLNPANLLNANSSTSLKGAGATDRAAALTAVITVRVSEVLPNGDLVVEGVREIQVNGDQQIIVLSGVARTTDIGPDNSVASTSIGQLRVRYFGNGLMKDSLSPGLLSRLLNKVF